MFLLFSMLPVLLVPGISGVAPGWLTALGLAVVPGFAFLRTDTNDRPDDPVDDQEPDPNFPWNPRKLPR